VDIIHQLREVLIIRKENKNKRSKCRGETFKKVIKNLTTDKPIPVITIRILAKYRQELVLWKPKLEHSLTILNCTEI
jgi:hypothetical protein